ncbi:MAG: hypothetical protein ACOCZ6_02500 [Nanoarchaeota archaeon]
MAHNKIIAMILFGILLTIAGCGEGELDDDAPGAETLTLDLECREGSESEREECCTEDCSEFCENEGYEMEKVETFQTNCGCWCE